MPVEVALWRVGTNLSPIRFSPIDTEFELEQFLAKNISIVDPNLLLIGRQVPTAQGKFIDLLALDGDGNVVVLELKRNRTPREVIAQLLDYGSWVRSLDDDDIADIFEHYKSKYYPEHASDSLDAAFVQHFKVQELPDTLNDSHRLVVVAAELDDSTERIIAYLADEYGVGINAVFFRYFKDGDHEYLSRAWLIDPNDVQAKVEEKREKTTWNGEYYVSFGGDPNRDWEEARKFGFISAGGGSWYTKSLGMLEPGSRVWVNTPGIGYVGVGEVSGTVKTIDEFLVDDGSGNETPVTQLAPKAAKLVRAAEDEERAEHLVRVKWIKTVPTEGAIREKGFFGNQNTVAKPRSKAWVHTIDRLRARFGITD